VLILDWDAATDGRSEFAQTLRESVRAVGGVHICDRRELFEELGDRYFDHERVSMTGTRVSRQGAVHTARQLSGWLTAVLEPRLKAVVVDLDNTLYRGVIGEDGIHAVLLTEAHAELQRTLLSLRESGVFLGVVSRNEPADVRELFSTRPDFPLSWDDFSAHSIGWQPKSEGIIAVAKALRIDVGAILFVDDNVGELLEAAQRVPWIRCVHAEWEADRTAAALRYFPSLSMLEGGAEDGLRIADLRANDERERVLESAGEDLESYYRELGVRLTVDPRPSEAIGRVAELSRKTNQFNLAMQRYSEADLQRRLETGQWELATVRLEDRLTDSGVIATAVVERRGQTLVVHELCISCRALGRRLEDLIVAQLITHGALSQDVNEVVFRFVDGPRNRPARTWLSNFVGRPIPVAPDLTDVAVPADRVAEASVNPYISIQVNS
jgi:FkbH-like protein